MKCRVLMGIVLCLTSVAFASDTLSQTNVTVFQRALLNALDVTRIAGHDLDRLRDMPLKEHLQILESVDPLSTNISDLGLATDVLTVLGRRCFTQDEVVSLQSTLAVLRERWEALDPGDDPTTRTFLRGLPDLLDFVIEAAKSQLVLEDRLRVLCEQQSSSHALVFSIAGFDPAIRPVESSTIQLLAREAVPVCDSLLPSGKPLPFNQWWSPDEYAWRDVALRNAHQAKVLIFLNQSDPVLYVILFSGELWIGPCGTSPTRCAFSFGPNPAEALYDALEKVVNQGDGSGSDSHRTQDSEDDTSSQIPPE